MRSKAVPPRVLGIVVLAVGTLVAATVYGEYNGASGPTRQLLTVDVIAGVLGLALLPFLYRRPVPTTLALALLSLASPALVPTSTIAILQVARLRPLRTAFMVAVPGVLAHVLRSLWRPVNGLDTGWYALLGCAVYAALLAWGARGRIQDELIASLRDRARVAEAEQARLVAEARRAERTRMAREMHDGLAHRLSMVATHAGALEFRPDASPASIAAAAGVVRAGIHEAMDELRDVILLLREDPTPDHSIPAAANGEAVPARRPLPTLSDLPALVAELERVGATIGMSLGPATTDRLSAGASRAAYRVVQEALTNARRHAPAQPVTVTIGGRPGARLTLEVTNPAAHADPAPRPGPGIGAGLGLIGLRERVELAGGELDAGLDGDRFRVRAWLPWPDGATGARAAR